MSLRRPLARTSLAGLLLLGACGGTDASEKSAPANAPADSAPASTSPRASGRAAYALSPTDSSWAGLVLRLSEPGGYFDTDNLISNESSYLHVLGALERLGVEGGAYIGVGPDQNFSYMAQIRPEVAFIVDIRRDNMLEQLLFKALFELADDRAEYLSLLVGRGVPEGDRTGWSVEELVRRTDAEPGDPDRAEEAVATVRNRVGSFGLDLSDADLATVERFHRAFVEEGLDLRFRSYGRAPRFFYPTLRELILARDLEGRRRSYLADPLDFRFLRRMQEENRVIPVVGDLAGPHALAAVGREVSRRGLTVSAFYTSNVEFYLMQDRSFGRFAETVAGLPRSPASVLIRSCFNRCASVHPQAAEGHYSAQLLQRMDDFVQDWRGGGYGGYWDLVTRRSLPLR